MAEKKKIDLGITALDEMFMDDKTRQELSRPKIYEIPIELIDPFPDHRIKIRKAVIIHRKPPFHF